MKHTKPQKEPEYELEEEPFEDEEQPSDIYDVFQTGITIHTRQPIFNPDISLSDLTTNERRFIKEQVRTVHLISRYIKDPKWGQRLRNVMLMDINTIIITSRSKEGRLIKGLIQMITGEQATTQEAKKSLGLFQKIFTKQPPPEPEKGTQ